MACAKRLAFGYIDQPPLSIALLSAIQFLFGNSIYVVRILPALSIASTIFVTGLIAKRLGGGYASVFIAALASAVLPVFQIFGSFYSMNAYEPLIWSLIMLYSVKMVQENNPKYWFYIGIFMGIGLEMKHTIVTYGIALIIGILISEKRKLLFNRWAVWGGIACFMLILPNLVWQYVNDFPSLELYRNSFTAKNIEKSYLQVIIEQIIFTNPFIFVIWFAGLIYLLFPAGKPYRYMFYAYMFLLLIIVLGHSSRPDRIASIYTFLIATGAVAIDKLLKPAWKKFVLPLIVVSIIAGGVLLTPVFCPVLPPHSLKNYLSAIGLQIDIEEGKKGEPIPQWLADRIGWRELAADVAEVYHSLPESEKRNAVIITTNYGEAGALEYYGPEFALPAVYATHNSYHTWGPPSDTIRTYIGVYLEYDDVKDKFDSVKEAKVYHCPDCTRPQQNIPVYIMRGPKISIEKEWDKFRYYH
jgi:4-amino-4-deoxy-L-arabinose transferase-like glycosyltransferase